MPKGIPLPTSPAARGRGLKPPMSAILVESWLSPAARGRGLKHVGYTARMLVSRVARCARAWIETQAGDGGPDIVPSPAARGRGLKQASGASARRVEKSPAARGRGLKQLSQRNALWKREVARCARAWIETAANQQGEVVEEGRPLRAGVD